jgi:hypothetical protein
VRYRISITENFAVNPKQVFNFAYFGSSENWGFRIQTNIFTNLIPGAIRTARLQPAQGRIFYPELLQKGLPHS